MKKFFTAIVCGLTLCGTVMAGHGHGCGHCPPPPPRHHHHGGHCHHGNDGVALAAEIVGLVGAVARVAQPVLQPQQPQVVVVPQPVQTTQPAPQIVIQNNR